ncbi:hypothetical protein ACGF14_27235 [Streptomyces althioticus]
MLRPNGKPKDESRDERKDDSKGASTFNQQGQVVNGPQINADHVTLNRVDPHDIEHALAHNRARFLAKQEELRRKDEERREDELVSFMLTMAAINGFTFVLFLISTIGDAILNAVT